MKVSDEGTASAVPMVISGFPGSVQEFPALMELIQISHGACTRASWIAAGAAWASCGRTTRAGALCRNREDRELRLQLLAAAFRTLCRLFAEDQSLKLVVTFFTGVLKNWH
jgi:hypothetical protein